MPFLPVKDEHIPLLAKLGEIAVKWNYVEGHIRLLLSLLASDGVLDPLADRHKHDILTAQLGNVALIEAVRTLNNEFIKGEMHDHVDHAMTFFDTMREYRNYYVHSIVLLGFTKEGPIGLSQQITARNWLYLHQETITLEPVKAFLTDLERLNDYLVSIEMAICFPDGKVPLPFRSAPLREKPGLPGRLMKPRLRLLDVRNQPPSSEEK